MKSNLQSFGPWGYLIPYWKRLLVGVVALLASNGLVVTIPWFLGETINALRGPDAATAVPPLAIAIVILAATQALVRILSRIAVFNAARMAEYDLRADAFSHLLKLDPGYYRKNRTGDVMSRLTNDVQTVRALWGPGVLNIVNTAVAFTSALILMIHLDSVLTLWALAPFPCIILFGRMFGRKIYKASRAVQKQLGALSSSIQQDLSGIAVIKSFTLEDNRTEHFRGESDQLLHDNMAVVWIRGLLMPILGGLASLGTVIVIWVGGTAVVEGRMNLGQLVQFNAYLAYLVWPTMALGWMISLIQRGIASWNRIQHILGTEPSVQSGDQPVSEPQIGQIEFRDLTVEMDGHRILDRISLTVPAGKVTAIVGRTGSGKTTLVETIPRFVEVPPGSVLLDGMDITQVPLQQLRSAISYAPQDSFLFSTTIEDNIGFGSDHPDTQTLQNAAEAAGLTADLASFPKGWDTIIGERGITLSGGQRQRVALARALASGNRVVILDDSLSSVDAETERTILNHIDDVVGDRTVILISHRIAAVKRADQIAVLDEGRLVETGTHEQLLAKNGLYAELYQTQLATQVSIDG